MNEPVPGAEPVGATTRVVLLTLALPRSDTDKNGRFNVHQAQALSRASGARTLIITVYPWWIRLAHRVAGRSAGPDDLHHDGVDVVVTRGLFWYFHPVVLPLQNRWPRLVTRWLDLACGRHVARIVDRHGVDLVVAQAVLPWGDLALRLKRRFGVPVLFTEHDGRLLSESRLAKSAPVLRQLCGEADGTLVVNAAGAERMRGHGVPRVHHVANGVDADAVERAAVPRPPEQEGRFVVLWAGTLRPEKGLDLLVEACAELAADVPVTLVAVGGEGWSPPEGRVLPPGLSLDLRPLTDQETVFGLMSWCDVFALPSWNEAWGLVIAEAMAVGRPVVMTTGCGMASEVEDGREGFVVPPRRADVVAVALRALAADEGLRAEMGRHGTERARALSWDHNARRVLELGGREPVSD